MSNGSDFFLTYFFFVYCHTIFAALIFCMHLLLDCTLCANKYWIYITIYGAANDDTAGIMTSLGFLGLLLIVDPRSCGRYTSVARTDLALAKKSLRGDSPLTDLAISGPMGRWRVECHLSWLSNKLISNDSKIVFRATIANDIIQNIKNNIFVSPWPFRPKGVLVACVRLSVRPSVRELVTDLNWNHQICTQRASAGTLSWYWKWGSLT